VEAGKGEEMETEVPKPALEELVGAITAAHTRGAMSTETYTALAALKPKPADGKPEAEPEFEILENPARVLPTQERHNPYPHPYPNLFTLTLHAAHAGARHLAHPNLTRTLTLTLTRLP